MYAHIKVKICRLLNLAGAQNSYFLHESTKASPPFSNAEAGIGEAHTINPKSKKGKWETVFLTHTNGVKMTVEKGMGRLRESNVRAGFKIGDLSARKALMGRSEGKKSAKKS